MSWSITGKCPLLTAELPSLSVMAIQDFLEGLMIGIIPDISRGEL